jgi:hypothetical protein
MIWYYFHGVNNCPCLFVVAVVAVFDFVPSSVLGPTELSQTHALWPAESPLTGL